jgi:hypothetical protein
LREVGEPGQSQFMSAILIPAANDGVNPSRLLVTLQQLPGGITVTREERNIAVVRRFIDSAINGPDFNNRHTTASTFTPPAELSFAHLPGIESGGQHLPVRGSDLATAQLSAPALLDPVIVSAQATGSVTPRWETSQSARHHGARPKRHVPGRRPCCSGGEARGG